MTHSKQDSSPRRRTSIETVADPATFRIDDEDCALFDRELRTFVPPDAFDVHAHLYDLAVVAPSRTAEKPARVGYDVYLRCQQAWMGEKTPSGGLFFAFPKAGIDVPAANRFVRDEIRSRSAHRGLMIIRPTDDPADVEAQVRREGWAGFKVYHVYANRTDTFNADTSEFLPQWAWQVADRHGLAITLHMVLRRAIADERNQQYISSHCKQYPNAKLILAHAARGFCGAHTVEGIDSLRGLGNVYFDTSAVCDAHAFEAILRTFGPTRLMYGGDFPVSEAHGRPVSIGDGFCWLYQDELDLRDWPLGRPTLVGIESLLALRQACRTMRLNDSDIERIFRGNARELLGILPRSDGAGQAMYRRAKSIIPGGTQLLSKRPEMYAPEQWPPYFREARGCEIIDADGRRFIDFSMNGIGACTLGYADPDVTDAVIRRVQLGSMSTLNSPDEVELAEMLLDMHPWARGVRYARGGGEAMAVAVRIARAATGRDLIAFCGYHGWCDWYLAANLGDSAALDGHLLPGLSPAGVPRGLSASAIPFAFNRLDQITAIVKEHGTRLAAIVMEPTRSVDPDPKFLAGVRTLCDSSGAKLVFDEVSAGFRFCFGGAHLRYGVEPDAAVFAKAMGNGHPVAAIIGKNDTMQAAQSSFISSTYWTDGVGPAAAIATLRKMRRVDLPKHLHHIGTIFRDGSARLAKQHEIPLRITGHPAMTYLAFDHPESGALMTLFTARMLTRGYLCGGGFYATLAHQDHHVQEFLAAAEPVYAELAIAIRAGDIAARVGGPLKHGGFARLA